MKITLRDVANKAGLSITTVSRALNGYDDVAEETRLVVQAAADELGYAPNLQARRLKMQRTDTLGFIMPTFGPRFSDPFFSEFLAGIGNEAAEHNYDLLVSTHAPDSEREAAAYRRAVNGGWVDGLIVVRTREQDSRIQLLQSRGFPFVTFGRTNTPNPYAYIDVDSRHGVHQLIQHLIDAGHKTIGFIAPPSGLMFGRHRSEAFYATMAEAGLPVNPDWVVVSDMTQRGGRAAIDEILQNETLPSAVFAANDMMALGAMARLLERGFVIGRDIAIAGFDDIPTSAYAHPPLTTVHQPIYDIGRRCCQMLLDLITQRPATLPFEMIKPELIVRESSSSALA